MRHGSMTPRERLSSIRRAPEARGLAVPPSVRSAPSWSQALRCERAIPHGVGLGTATTRAQQPPGGARTCLNPWRTPAQREPLDPYFRWKVNSLRHPDAFSAVAWPSMHRELEHHILEFFHAELIPAAREPDPGSRRRRP